MLTNIQTKVRDLKSYVDDNEIYLSDEITLLVHVFIQNTWEPVAYTGTYTNWGSASDETKRKHGDVLLAAMKKAHEEIPAIRRKLVLEFREILGTVPKAQN